MSPSNVDTIIRTVENLRPMPTSITRALRAIEDSNATSVEISEIIGLDQALSASILQSANSVAMGFSTDCSKLSEAVMRLGFKRLKGLILGIAAVGPFNQSLKGYRFGAGELWNHSIATAVSAEWIARELRYPDPEEAYTAGLLHDMGKLFLDQFVFSDYTRIVDLMLKYKLTLYMAEEQLLGIDHAKVGGLIAEKWNFPVVLVDAIRYHHTPSFARSNQRLPSIVNIANSFFENTGNQNALFFERSIHPETFQILNISQERIDQMHVQLTNYMLSSG
ncbi:MAG: metal dependent phosphohydrolase [uncultured bacterium]|nr:MAG: metal dependent phosphohydrolase [uncultured bacterium]